MRAPADQPLVLPVILDQADSIRLTGSVLLGPTDEDPDATRDRLSPHFRIAPLIRVVPDIPAELSPEVPERLLLVGQWRVSVHPNHTAAVEVHELRVWAEASGWSQDPVLAARAVELLCALPLGSSHRTMSADAEEHAALLAKALAERSRDAVRELRDVRYEMERELSDALDHADDRLGLEFVARLVRMKSAVGQARDQVREAIREGLWLHLSDPSAYHAYRRAADPTLLVEQEPATPVTRTWMRQHDAAVRQCHAAAEELGEDAASLEGSLDAATTIALAREARAQEEFNRWAGVAALGLGLPSVVLAYLGASDFLPLDPFGATLIPLIPVFAALVVALVLSRKRLPPGTVRPAWLLLGAIAVLIVVTGLSARFGLRAR